jgi:hypothetical protein
MGISSNGKFDDIDDAVKAEAVLTITTTAQEAKGGATALDGRQTLRVFNSGPQVIYWGLSNSVSSTNGEPIFKNQGITFMYGPDIHVWLITATATASVVVKETG